MMTLDAFDQDSAYLKFASRYPAFLQTFPATEFSIHTEVSSLLSIDPNFANLYLAAVNSNGLQNSGLPPLVVQTEENGAPFQSTVVFNLIVFKATLVHTATDKVIRTAHALRAITDMYAFEKCETAAVQRLIALSGYSSEILLDDENTTAPATPDQKVPAVSVPVPKATASTCSAVVPIKPHSKGDVSPVLHNQLKGYERKLRTLGYRLREDSLPTDQESAKQLNSMLGLFFQSVEQARLANKTINVPDWIIASAAATGG